MESLSSVLPITAIVLILCFSVSPIPTAVLLSFIVGALLLIIGMGLFTLGAETAMQPIGERIGGYVTKKRKIGLILPVTLALGFLVTVSEPDLHVLAEQVPGISNGILIGAVSLGVAVFLGVAVLRIIFKIRLSYLLMGFYIALFVLAYFVPKDFLSVAFDSGGVTTGPMTVPLIMAFGIGISSVRGDSGASDDSFGLVALASIGPIIAVLILGIIFKEAGGTYVPNPPFEAENTRALWRHFAVEFPSGMKDVLFALGPISACFVLFDLFFLKLPKKQLIRILIGLLYTFFGLVIFLTGVNVGFLPAGNYIGSVIAANKNNWILVPIGMLMGYFIVQAEPAVHVLNKQVEQISAGTISARSMNISLSVGVAVSLGLAMLRVITGLHVLWLLIPGYTLAIAMSFFSPKLFTAIAFDSGGVASGPMTATFLLPFAMGACSALGGNVVADAFGLVAMVAMTPLITIQGLGILYRRKQRILDRPGDEDIEEIPVGYASDDDDIVEL